MSTQGQQPAAGTARPNNAPAVDLTVPGQTGSSAAAQLAAAEGPVDAKVIGKILTSMGVNDWEPRVVNQLLEFTHRYVSEVFQDAVVYSDHAGKSKLDLDDVKLAIQSRVNFSFAQPPPREFLLGLSNDKNATPLNLIPKKLGVHLPPDRYCLTAPNFQVKASAAKPPAAAIDASAGEGAANSGARGNGNVKMSSNQIQINVDAPPTTNDDDDDYDMED